MGCGGEQKERSREATNSPTWNLERLRALQFKMLWFTNGSFQISSRFHYLFNFFPHMSMCFSALWILKKKTSSVACEITSDSANDVRRAIFLQRTFPIHLLHFTVTYRHVHVLDGLFFFKSTCSSYPQHDLL